MFAGWFTPTEAGAVGVALMLVVTVIFRRFNWKMLLRAGENTLVVSGMMYCMLAGANVFGKFFTLTRIPTTLGDLVSNLDVPVVMVILIITIIYLILGCFIDALPLMLLTAPIFLPVVQALGYDAVWSAVTSGINGPGSHNSSVGISCYLVPVSARELRSRRF
jgi:TRAP-type C4-dicarboxylate transport system permease large subunit